MGFIKRIVKKVFLVGGIVIQRAPKNALLQSKENSIEEDTQYRWIGNYGFKTIIDVGANEGQFAMKFRKLLPDAFIYSFEPLPGVYEHLKANFLNDMNFKAFNFALGTSVESRIIHLNEYSPSSSILPIADEHKKHFDFARKETPCEIKVSRLDILVNDANLVDPVLIKIDVQGFEEYVIDGGLDIIKRCRLMIIEVSFKKLYHHQPLFDDIYRKLLALGFTYAGNFEQLASPIDGEILQADAIFVNSAN